MGEGGGEGARGRGGAEGGVLDGGMGTPRARASSESGGAKTRERATPGDRAGKTRLVFWGSRRHRRGRPRRGAARRSTPRAKESSCGGSDEPTSRERKRQTMNNNNTPDCTNAQQPRLDGHSASSPTLGRAPPREGPPRGMTLSPELVGDAELHRALLSLNITTPRQLRAAVDAPCQLATEAGLGRRAPGRRRLRLPRRAVRAERRARARRTRACARPSSSASCANSSRASPRTPRAPLARRWTSCSGC